MFARVFQQCLAKFTFLTHLAGSSARLTPYGRHIKIYQYPGGPISMAEGRLDSRFELGSLIQGFDTKNMIFEKTSEIKSDQKIFEELEFLQIIFI
jgi:hypothetical protein